MSPLKTSSGVAFGEVGTPAPDKNENALDTPVTRNSEASSTNVRGLRIGMELITYDFCLHEWDKLARGDGYDGSDENVTLISPVFATYENWGSG
jgi:hypothetical protein